ncbi:hypothetical protein [Desulfolutivibrio sulfoxidireducens]|jgi:hypothetical protein|uniref:hypothetical protein n=1 Tax=Desulfolutivibrio sulfoxidireducens TaxID=2773299 RepID=UPI00159E38A9|nr:hypothetical protein [Desulfolutivibrio sulfoxidireducens]QLA16505.1 hypothetical protein GD605_10420 [Desulfolutivibrio sulfoxidireducens]QLA19617.1 hypothetical protein GD604_07650 [Desulfolutivibrio sulfoxidireducens]
MKTQRCIAADAQGALPFFGLGFDLDAVRLRAESISWSGCERAKADVPLAKIPVTWLAAGYALQLRLGREIRGC